ncbi:hypothetical protein KZ770_03095 [Escherichia coli]|nr:hypothetical protein [Escherichia coli]
MSPWRGEAIPGSLFDFALYFFHNYQALLAKGSGPYFYLPKTQSPAGSGPGGAKSSAMQKIALICRAAPSRRRC